VIESLLVLFVAVSAITGASLVFVHPASAQEKPDAPVPKVAAWEGSDTKADLSALGCARAQPKGRDDRIFGWCTHRE
jgi:hypothetical protein